MKPGETVEARAEIPTSGLDGVLVKRFTLNGDSASADWKKVELIVRADIKPLLVAVPSRVDLGTLSKGSGTAKPFAVRSLFENLPGMFRSVESENPAVKVRVLQKMPGMLRCEVSIDGESVPVGEFVSRIVFHFDSKEIPRLELLVSGRRAGELSFLPSRVVMTKSSGRSAPDWVSLRSTMERPFRVLEWSAPPGIEVACNDSKTTAQEHRVALRAAGSTRITDHEGFEVVVVTDDAFEERVRIPVVLLQN